MSHDRRNILKLMGSGALAAAFPASIKRALAIPAHHRSGSIADVEHIIILMQENRSFDHYFGTMRGVRGFADPRRVVLPNGDPVWAQPGGPGRVMPFHPDAPNLGLQFLEDLPHGWRDTHQAWNGGKYDQWVPAKGTTTMSYLTRADIPYHFALADAFTVCDAYYCSFMGATDPNRYHMWTGWTGNDGKGGGPVLDNSEAGYDWGTYPERLQRAGVSWKIYQDAGAGLDGEHYWGWGSDPYIGNYGDNSLLYFHQYQAATPGSPLYEGARTATDVAKGGTLFDIFKRDVESGNLPQVSWIVAPEAYTEHPNWPANYGAWYIDQILDALTAHPEVFSKTALFIMYDENDGFFDHMVPPTPPRSRADGLSTIDVTNEIFAGNSQYEGGPYGLGVRVPMIVVSPWSKGGWVNSQVFDHTSLIQFIERRFAGHNRDLIETNITAWRRAIAGDLTSAFDFRAPDAAIVGLPSTDAYAPPDRAIHPDYRPAVPAVQALPTQEPGVRPARALPYELHAHGRARHTDGSFEIAFANTGRAAAVYQVRCGNAQLGPWTYTVGAGDRLRDRWDIGKSGLRAYDLSVYGPNGFFRSFKGSMEGPDCTSLVIHATYDGCGISLELHNQGAARRHVRITDGYAKETIELSVGAGRSGVWHWSLEASFGWYDLTVEVEHDGSFRQQLAGHVETGRDSVSDPLLGA